MSAGPFAILPKVRKGALNMMKQKTAGRLAALMLATVMMWQGCPQVFAETAAPGSAVPLVQNNKNETQSDANSLERVDEALEKALNYLDQVTVDPGANGGQGEWSVLSLARNDRLSEETREIYLENLKARAQEKNGVLSTRKYTEYSRTILVLTALGENPQSFAGYDFAAPLEEFENVCAQGINGPIWALLALDSGNYEFCAENSSKVQGEKTTRDGLIDYILEHKLADGGWSFFEKPDDMTAMAIQALVPYYNRAEVKQAVDDAVDLLSTMQEEDGGFGLSGGAESISQVMIALAALNPNLLQDERFVKNGNTLLDALLRYQTEDGSFRHRLDGKADGIATDQATLALTAYQRAMCGKSGLYDMSNAQKEQSANAQQQKQENWAFVLVGGCLCVASCAMLGRRKRKEDVDAKKP